MTIGYMIAKILNTFGKCLKRRKDIWVFGAWSGQNFSDNPKYLFEYVNNNNKEITAVWLTRSKSVVKEIRALGYKCYTYNSLRGMYFALFAGAAFETAGNEDISPLIDNKLTKTIMMWHGVGGKQSIWKGKHSSEMYEKGKYDYFPASSELYIELMGNKLDRKNFSITGQARDDTFVTRPECIKVKEVLNRFDADRYIIYMPTHRDYGKHGNDFINLHEFERLNEYLQEHRYVLIYKPHFHELQHFLDLKAEYTNIVFAKEQYWSDPYSYLHYFDLMISDYSSCAYDFLCAEKPIVLFTYDIDDYKEGDFGLDESFWTYPIGPFCESWDEVYSAIDDAFSLDSWKEKRDICKQVFHTYNDGNNCRRIYQWVTSLLNGN